MIFYHKAVWRKLTLCRIKVSQRVMNKIWSNCTQR